MFQLYLFEAMGKKLDKSHSLYKQYNLQIIAKQVQKTGELKVNNAHSQDVNPLMMFV